MGKGLSPPTSNPSHILSTADNSCQCDYYASQLESEKWHVFYGLLVCLYARSEKLALKVKKLLVLVKDLIPWYQLEMCPEDSYYIDEMNITRRNLLHNHSCVVTV
ncbi:hypothetical protein VNO77_16468 [Canavalia gladiata]|uniref:Uncharacterized protein n=1 Tax=Canavalia gladiata TaxID=3824 RepID=A0AAN9M0F7_CANGL